MKLSTEILSDLSRLDGLVPDWEALVAEDRDGLRGLDATNGPDWFQALTRTFPAARSARIVVLRNHGEVAGVLPLIAEPGRLGCRQLTLATSLYGGRNGFLLKYPDPALLGALLQAAKQAFGPWQSIRITLVDDSPSERLLRTVCPQLGLRIIEEPGSESPFFPVLADEQQFMAGMSKGLKQTMRTATNKFRSMGQLRVVEIADPASADKALDAILSIDRASWKQAAGSAITSKPTQEAFCRAFFAPALRAGLLYGQVLYLDESPLAYNYGLLKSGVYSSLNVSQTAEYEALSPGHLVNLHLINALRERGVVMFDYMGKAEPHKLRWSNHTQLYKRHQIWVYGRGACGAAGYFVHKLKRAAKRVLAARSVSGDHVRRSSR